jgi:lipopolysaccharide/colanic/teichoic acid biosynthesis glycosyltransferase
MKRAADVDRVAVPYAQRALDVVLAAIGLAILAVPMLLIAALVRMGSRGPALFAQRRVGIGGHTFTMFKFRTMRVGGDDQALRELVTRELRGEDTVVDGSCKLDHEGTVTWIGSVLRRTSLDELPQLINVLRGEMSLVGPRPCLEWEADMFPGV